MELDQLAPLIERSPTLQRFFELASKHTGVRSVLFAHPEDLFLSSEDATFALFPAANPTWDWSGFENRELTFAVGPAYTDDEEAMEIQKEMAMELMKRARIDPERAIRDAQDLFAYVVLSVIRQNEELVELVNAERIDFPALKQALEDYSKLDFELDLTEDPAVPGRIQHLIERGEEFLQRALETTAEEMLERLPQMLDDPVPMFSLRASRRYVHDMTRSRFDDYDQYIGVLDLLWQEDLVDAQRVFWTCPSSRHQYAPNLVFRENLPPSDLDARECPQCDAEMVGHAFYHVDPELKAAMMSADGLLAGYVHWLLKGEGYEPAVSVDLQRGEVDFLLDGPKLIECKVWVDGSVPDWDRQALLDQVSRQAEDAMAGGEETCSVGVSTNVRDSEEVADLEQYLSTELPESVSVSVAGQIGFEETLREFLAR